MALLTKKYENGKVQNFRTSRTGDQRIQISQTDMSHVTNI